MKNWNSIFRSNNKNISSLKHTKSNLISDFGTEQFFNSIGLIENLNIFELYLGRFKEKNKLIKIRKNDNTIHISNSNFICLENAKIHKWGISFDRLKIQKILRTFEFNQLNLFSQLEGISEVILPTKVTIRLQRYFVFKIKKKWEFNHI